MKQQGWNITIKEILTLPIYSFIELNKVTCLFLIKALHPLLYMYNLVSTNDDLSAEHSNQTLEKTPEMKLGIDLHSLVFNVLPGTKIKRINHATHLFIFIRPNGRQALSQRESPTNVVTQKDPQEGGLLWHACCVHLHESLHSWSVEGGCSAGHYLEILLLERIIHGIIQMWLYILSSWYPEGTQSVQFTLHYKLPSLLWPLPANCR